ncbi:hypothetical protein IEQ34_010381 [Dendrobium chrysotoxum]|uniref:WRKY domain-containing protein n=1 Tax=Dendrobium chrysotoxum TaxID=161865 RepID=A0AAV7H1B3_DENCH|nr:hypothetical protein IEQ34_010381 [Dendrobium chrysotoxum]
MQEENIGFWSHASVQIDSVVTCNTKVSLISMRTDHHIDSSLDGYKWSKYGQKLTKGNSSLRTYFRCAMAPICPVKKKVQRSAEDKSVVVAIYEGEHNHPIHSNCKESIQNHLDDNSVKELFCNAFLNSFSTNVDLELSL